MKKIFTLFVAFIALTFCAKAQVTIILEAHDVWEDGSGYQLLLDADHNTYGTVIPETGPLTTSGDAPASVYAEFEYKVPVNADGSLTTSNIVMDGTATITIPAGIYDFCITNPTPGDRVWIAGESIDPTRGDDYEFLDGRTYHFLMARNGNNDACTMTVIFTPTEPTISATPTSVNFGNVSLGTTANSTVSLTNYLLTTDVTATTTAPFAVSADGTNFGTTATIAATGGTLYVQYAPTAVGTDNGTVTLTSTGATNVTVNLTGNAIDCSNITIPFTEGFESSIDCWTMVSMDPANDDRFGVYADAEAYEGSNDFRFSSFSSASDYNQYLITPQLTLTGNDTYLARFFYKGYNSNESFKVMYSTTNTDLSSFTVLADYPTVQTSWTEVAVELPAGTKYVAINYYGNYQYYLYIDNFTVGAATPSMAISTDALDFGANEMGTTTDAQTVVLSTISVNEAFTLTTAAPFEVSLDGTNFAATQTIPANATTVVHDTIYVRFAPTAAGSFNQNLTIASASYSDTVALTGEAVDCANSIITTLPYTYDFNTGTYPPLCWTVNDPANYSQASVDGAGDFALYIAAADKIVMPEIQNNSAMMFTFGYRTYFGSTATAPTIFRVGTSSTDNSAASFTWQNEVSVNYDPADGNIFTTHTAIIPANTKYIAVEVTSMGAGLYYGIFEMSDVFYVDNFNLTALNDPTMLVSEESIAFGSITMGTTSAPKAVNVIGALLTNDITVTAPANFEVSTNGTSFAATATLPAAGGNFQVRYNPTAAGNHSGNVTLTSGSITKNIAVSGSAVDCSAPKTLPFTEDFEGGMPACWTILDQDGDGYSWESSFEPVSYYSSNVDLSGSGNNGSDGFVMSGSYSNALGTALTPDNWLITPALVIPSNGATLTWAVSAVDANYAEEYYEVMLSTSLNPSSFTSVFNETLQINEWEQRSVSISGNYAGQNVYVAFRNYNTSNIFLMKVDDINVTAGVGVDNHETTTSIYPNPAKNVLNITSNENINRVEVFNMMGQMVGSYDANDTYTQINTTAFANGVYTVKIETENGTTTRKFTVAR